MLSVEYALFTSGRALSAAIDAYGLPSTWMCTRIDAFGVSASNAQPRTKTVMSEFTLISSRLPCGLFEAGFGVALGSVAGLSFDTDAVGEPNQSVHRRQKLRLPYAEQPSPLP